jgi:hypothetical protein
MRRAVKRYNVLLEFLIALGILPGCVWSVPTVCVTGWLEPKKTPKNAARTTRRVHAAKRPALRGYVCHSCLIITQENRHKPTLPIF